MSFEAVLATLNFIDKNQSIVHPCFKHLFKLIYSFNNNNFIKTGLVKVSN